jgi:hypothetical protein
MCAQWRTVDYSLQRRAVLREFYAGRIGRLDVCDASPYLKSAARFHGEATEEPCPICRRDFVTRVHYIYGDQLKQSAGQARKRDELAVLADTLGEFQVFVVEVCRRCDWNYLVEQYLLGNTPSANERSPADRQHRGSAKGIVRGRASAPAKAPTGTV